MLQEMIWRGRGPQGDAELTAVLVACTLRVLLASLAGAATPSSLTLDVGLGFLSAEAIFLALLPLLLPLPLKHHLWAQLLALRSALGRMRRLAAVHAALPQGPGECARFVRCARLAMEAVAPGGPSQLPCPSAQQCCWLAHVWGTVMVGFALPTAVQAALTAHWQKHAWRWQQLPGQPAELSEVRQEVQPSSQPGPPAEQRQRPQQQQQRWRRWRQGSSSSSSSSSCKRSTSSSRLSDSSLGCPQPGPLVAAGWRLWQPLLHFLLLAPAGVALWAVLEAAAALGMAG